MISFACNKCGGKMKIGDSQAGKTVQCTLCKADTEVPELEIERFVRGHLKSIEDHASVTRYRVGCLVWMVAIGLFVLCFGGLAIVSR